MTCWFLRLPPSGLSPTSMNESTPYDVNFSYCLFLGMNVWRYSRNQEQELWSSILIMLMRQFVCFLYNKIVAALQANHTRTAWLLLLSVVPSQNYSYYPSFPNEGFVVVCFQQILMSKIHDNFNNNSICINFFLSCQL